jgi:hypothetical protein
MNADLERINEKAAAKRLRVVKNPDLPRGANSNPNLVRWHLIDLRHGLAFKARSLADAEKFIEARCVGEVAP